MSVSLLEIQQQALQLEPDEQLALMEQLARELRENGRKKTPKKRYGAWKEYFSEDFDVDAALKEIRSEWEAEMDEI